MAQIFPENISYMGPTASEIKVYTALKEKLNDDYTVFYSIKWFEYEDSVKKISECDFLIFNKNYGYVTLEVKGGTGIVVENNDWYLVDHGERRKLRCSPHEQAEDSMRYFKKYFERQFNYTFNGIYGAAVIFPNFIIENKELLTNRAKELTLDARDFNDLSDKIEDIFKVWAGDRFGYLRFSKSQQLNFINIVKKKIALSAAAGVLIEKMNEKLELINRVQNNIVYLLSNYTQLYLTGGPGTGKTNIGIKLAFKSFFSGKKVLFICLTDNLKEYIAKQLNYEGIDIITSVEIDLLEKRYETIIVDEAQDIDSETLLKIKSLLIDDNSDLFVLYDDLQNVTNKSFNNLLDLKFPPFLLRENLRNTKNIFKYAIKETNLGKNTLLNEIEGPEPEKYTLSNEVELSAQINILLEELIVKEYVPISSIVILLDDCSKYRIANEEKVAGWSLRHGTKKDNFITVSSVYDYKGLESDVVIYIHSKYTKKNINYIGYTRARFYLYEIILL
ncbi:NERD domain-containing protein [Clostridium sp. C8-1-8]|uniref:NERD domain-containing protein n=1 Tax=Clostridium sp. C8-1-8 TaxID=2698831 RepID=UPI001369C732|nr:NERD domain-containing protein [Clostridium sp. C8-1-8]